MYRYMYIYVSRNHSFNFICSSHFLYSYQPVSIRGKYNSKMGYIQRKKKRLPVTLKRLNKGYLYQLLLQSFADTVWFIKITNDIDMPNDLIRNGCGNCVLGGQHYLKGHSLEKENTVKNGYIQKVNKKHLLIFFKESILYPFVRFADTPKALLLKNEDFVDILMLAHRVLVLPQLYKQTKKFVKKQNLCVLLFYLEIFQFSSYLQKVFAVSFPPNFI